MSGVRPAEASDARAASTKRRMPGDEKESERARARVPCGVCVCKRSKKRLPRGGLGRVRECLRVCGVCGWVRVRWAAAAAAGRGEAGGRRGGGECADATQTLAEAPPHPARAPPPPGRRPGRPLPPGLGGRADASCFPTRGRGWRARGGRGGAPACAPAVFLSHLEFSRVCVRACRLPTPALALLRSPPSPNAPPRVPPARAAHRPPPPQPRPSHPLGRPPPAGGGRGCPGGRRGPPGVGARRAPRLLGRDDSRPARGGADPASGRAGRGARARCRPPALVGTFSLSTEAG